MIAHAPKCKLAVTFDWGQPQYEHLQAGVVGLSAERELTLAPHSINSQEPTKVSLSKNHTDHGPVATITRRKERGEEGGERKRQKQTTLTFLQEYDYPLTNIWE